LLEEEDFSEYNASNPNDEANLFMQLLLILYAREGKGFMTFVGISSAGNSLFLIRSRLSNISSFEE
jgi:hypothetical protein